MRHLLFSLFLSVACYPQGAAKLTAYRQVHTFDDGPCTVKAYVEMEKWMAYMTYVTEESYDSKLIDDLLAIKRQAKHWKKSDCGCDGTSRGYQWGSIPHMFVIEKNNGNDTIYTNYDNSQIIFPKKQEAYHDEKGLFTKALRGTIKDFFEHDFDKQLRAMFVAENDSIPDIEITFNGKQAYKYIMDDFRNNTGDFSLTSSDSLYNDIRWIFNHGSDTIIFHEGSSKILLYDRNSEFAVSGIKPGHSEQILLEKFPESTDVQLYYSIRFEDIKRMYYYIVELEGGKGHISFFIKNGLIDYMRINFNKKRSG